MENKNIKYALVFSNISDLTEKFNQIVEIHQKYALELKSKLAPIINPDEETIKNGIPFSSDLKTGLLVNICLIPDDKMDQFKTIKNEYNHNLEDAYLKIGVKQHDPIIYQTPKPENYIGNKTISEM